MLGVGPGCDRHATAPLLRRQNVYLQAECVQPLLS